MNIEEMLTQSEAVETTETETEGAETPETETGGAETPETESFDFTKTFEGFETIDQVKELANRGKQFSSEVEEELKSLRQAKEKFETLESEREKLKTFNPYKNEKFYKLDKLAETDPDHVEIYQKYLLGNTSDLEVVKLGETLKNGDIFKDDMEALQRRIEAKYPALFDGSDENDDEYKDALINLRLDAKEVRNSFDSKINSISLPDVEQTAKEKEEADLNFVKSWQGDFAKIKDGLSAIPISIEDSSDPSKQIKVMDIPLTNDEAGNLQKVAAGFIINNRLDPTPENVEAAKKAAIGSYIVQNFAKIQTRFANKIEEDSGIKWRAKITNPEHGGAEHSPNNTKTFTEGSADAIFEDMTHG